MGDLLAINVNSSYTLRFEVYLVVEAAGLAEALGGGDEKLMAFAWWRIGGQATFYHGLDAVLYFAELISWSQATTKL